MVGFHVYHAILLYTEIHSNIGMLHSLFLMDPTESRVIMDSTNGISILYTILVIMMFLMMLMDGFGSIIINTNTQMQHTSYHSG